MILEGEGVWSETGGPCREAGEPRGSQEGKE
jgi:hypothetical protein